jgi:hypothetical protein
MLPHYIGHLLRCWKRQALNFHLSIDGFVNTDGQPLGLLSADDHRFRQPLSDQRQSVFAGQKVGVKQVDEHIWLVTFMHYDLGYFDDETGRLEPIGNPFGPKLLPMSPE